MSQAQDDEIAELRMQLREAQETIAAIQSGDVDAIVIGEDIYTMDSAQAASNKLRQGVLSQMEDAVLAFDMNDHLVFMNAAAEHMYGKTASDALGRVKDEVFVELWADDAARQKAAQTLDASGNFQADSVHRTAGGESVAVETRVSLLRDNMGKRIGELYVIRDISDRVAAEQALKDADRQKDEFLATLAHELRNPLAPIRNALQIMRLSSDLDVHEKTRSIIERQLRHMVRLVDDLLDVSRISQGKVQLQLQPSDLNQIVLVAVETSRPLIEAGGHDLEVKLPLPQTLVVNGDDTRLAQVISNLLNNAAKYTPEKGRIQISAFRDGTQAVVAVRDSGVGIPLEFLPKVFDLFTQIDRSMERSQGGLGIGLALVKRLVEMHGGSVHVKSDGTGEGSEFSIYLPLAASHASATPLPATDTTLPPQTSQNRRVLVVDDNVDGAETLAQVLMLVGYETRTVHDGVDALNAARDFLPHVVVLDIGLPLMNGHEVARRIRSQPWGEQMYLIALSGWGQDEDRRKSADAGFDRHFIKPVDLMELTEEVERVVG